MHNELKKLFSVRRSAFRAHRVLQGFYLREVALFVRADEGEPLVEVDRAPCGVREAYGRAVNALDARA